MITQSFEEFFSHHRVEPCHYCQKIKEPGKGIGPHVAEILLGCYRDAELRRIERKLSMNGESDNWDKKLAEENRALFIRACWLSGYDPDSQEITVDDIEMSKAA